MILSWKLGKVWPRWLRDWSAAEKYVIHAKK